MRFNLGPRRDRAQWRGVLRAEVEHLERLRAAGVTHVRGDVPIDDAIEGLLRELGEIQRAPCRQDCGRS